MSSEKTAEMFKNKSEEEIINWMIRNMSPEQIKSCFDGEILESTGESVAKVPDVNDLRRYCENKRYVIHKIEGDKVYFWYYLIKRELWQYSIEPLSNFPKSMGEMAEECGLDTTVTNDYANELKSSYNDNKLLQGKYKNDDVPINDAFNQIKSEYQKLNINDGWSEFEEVTNTLLTAISIQQSIPVNPELKSIFNYAPVLIEAVTETKVYYFYLKNVNEEVIFIYGNIKLENFGQDILEVMDDLNLQISSPSQPGGSNSKTVDEWKQEIINAANKINTIDLQTIQKNYSEFPLSTKSPFFMDNLFGTLSGGVTSFGDLNTQDLSMYIMNKFGKHTANLFKTKVISNKFGTKTISLVSK